jgi:hypothetical protein
LTLAIVPPLLSVFIGILERGRGANEGVSEAA